MATTSFVIPDLSRTVKINTPVSPTARFAGEFAAIADGKSFTKLIERGIILFADSVEHQGKGWRHYWERAEGSPEVAWALLYADRGMPFDEHQQAVRDLLLAHERFFFERHGQSLHPRRRNIEVLWPRVQTGELGAHWRKTKGDDPFATGDRMADILRRAKLKPPAWGPGHE